MGYCENRLELRFILVCAFEMMDCSGTSSVWVEIVNLLEVKCRQGLGNCKKFPHFFCFYKSVCLVDLKDLCLSK